MTRPSNTQMHEQPNSSDHDRHDLLAVAALADRDATGEEAARAQAQVDTCTECASLHAELVSLASATQHASSRCSDRATSSSGRRTPSDCARTGSVACSVHSVRPATVSAGRWRWVSRRSALLACCSGSCPARCRSVALRAPQAGRRRGRPRSRRSSRRWARRCRVGSAGSTGRGRRPRGAARRERTRRAGRARVRSRQWAWASTTATGRSPSRHRPDVDTFNQRDVAGEGQGLTSLSEDSTGVSVLIVISGTLLIIGLGLFALRWTSRRFGG